MFSVNQKRQISDAVQKILRETNHPELPDGEIQFKLHVDGAEGWSWADIQNNGSVDNPSVNPHNEQQDKSSLIHHVEESNYPNGNDINITIDDFNELKTLYADALNNSDQTFTFKNRVLVVDYAKHLIEHLENQFESM